MSEFSYTVKSSTEVKRLFLNDTMSKDRFAVIVDDDQLCEVSYDLARRYWLGKLTLPELLRQAEKAQT